MPSDEHRLTTALREQLRAASARNESLRLELGDFSAGTLPFPSLTVVANTHFDCGEQIGRHFRQRIRRAFEVATRALLSSNRESRLLWDLAALRPTSQCSSHLDFPGGVMTRLSSPVGVQALLGRSGFRA